MISIDVCTKFSFSILELCWKYCSLWCGVGIPMKFSHELVCQVCMYGRYAFRGCNSMRWSFFLAQTSCVRLYKSGLYHYYWDHFIKWDDDIILEQRMGCTRKERVVKTMLIPHACDSNVLKKLKYSMPVLSNLDDDCSFSKGDNCCDWNRGLPINSSSQQLEVSVAPIYSEMRKTPLKLY